MHKFKYEWSLKEADFTKDKGKVFSCFSCGGGSTMGYKLAGFDVIGCNEIDPKMMDTYIKNHNPKYSFLESIKDFKEREDLPEELYNLDILDGSPPCSNFSISGNREKDWGKMKKFREGQAEQVLDTLFFDFIDLAKRLQPKVVIAENVKGLLMGGAKKYVDRIYKEMKEAGYHLQHFVLNASKMGVPQRRQRVFFIGLRNDLVEPFLQINMNRADYFLMQPYINMDFSEKEIVYRDIEQDYDNQPGTHISKCVLPYWQKIKPGRSCADAHEKGHYFQEVKLSPDKSLPTLRAGNNSYYHYETPRKLIDKEIILGGSFPLDYDFNGNKVIYMVGMSVPPVMTANIASRIWDYWLSKI